MNSHPPTTLEPKPAPGGPVLAPPAGSRRAELSLAIFFLTLVASGLLIQTAVELRRSGGVRALEVFRQKPTSANLRAYERNLEDASVIARALRPWFQFAQFAWLRDGGEKALFGRDGWLFYKPGFDEMVARDAGPKTATNDPVSAIVAFRDELAARGIHLVVVPAPNKESVYPDLLTRRIPVGRGVISPGTLDVLTRLRSAGVECVDLFRVFAEARTNGVGHGRAPLYLAQDSHWSPRGLALAVEAVARRLVERGWVKPGAVDYEERPAPVERLGDVLRLLQAPRLESSAVLENVACAQVIRQDNARAYEDDPNSTILVLGDSFLRIFQRDEPGSAGFIAHLAKELKQPLASLVNDGGASTLVRQELCRRPSLLKNKQVVIWEFVERDIRLGAEGWQQVPLPALASQPRFTDPGMLTFPISLRAVQDAVNVTGTSSPPATLSLTLAVASQRAQTLDGFACSLANLSGMRIPQSARAEMFDRVFGDLRMNVLRLWAEAGDDHTAAQMRADFYRSYVDSGVIADAQKRGVTTLLLAPARGESAPTEPIPDYAWKWFHQSRAAFPNGSRLYPLKAQPGGDLSYTFEQKPFLNAAMARRPDGGWSLGIVNLSGLGPDTSSSQWQPPTTLNVPCGKWMPRW